MLIRSILLLLFISSPAAYAQQLSPLEQMGRQNFIQSNNPMNYLLNNPMNNSSVNTTNPYASLDSVPGFKTEFWNKSFNRRTINPGTVFNGILEDTISSKTSKVGDVFSILLTDGYTLNNTLLIPRNSKIVGTIVAVTSAKNTKFANPGTLQISLQTLVTPDSISVPISAFIDYNPNQPQNVDPKKGRGVPVAEWGKSVEYSVYYAAAGLGRRMGIPVSKNQNGKGVDFVINQGELVPVRLNHPLDVTALNAGKEEPAVNSPNTNIAPTMDRVIPNSDPAPGLENLSAPYNNTAPGLPAAGSAPFSMDDTNNMAPNSVLPAGPEPF